MEIDRCRHCGLCGGVRRALNLAERLAAEGRRVHCCGELAHSTLLQNFLREGGISVWTGEERHWERRDCLLIPTHGISPARRERLRSEGPDQFDGTCPIVRRNGERIRRLSAEGFRILLFGKKNHPEVVGLAGQGPVAICESESDLPRPDGRRTALFSQTTADGEELAHFAAVVRDRFPNLKAVPSLCREVLLRRKELYQALADGSYGWVVVVAGERSANGRALAAIARRAGVAVAVAERPEELPNCIPWGVGGRLLIASATSAPDWAVDGMEQFLRKRAGGLFPAAGLGGAGPI